MSPVPLHAAKLAEPSILAAEVLAGHDAEHGFDAGSERIAAAVLVYHRGLAESAVADRWPAEHRPGFIADRFVLEAGAAGSDARGGRIAIVANFGIGAPAAVFALEELIAAGAHTVLSVGTSGGVHPDLAAGDLVLVDEALRDEGTSYHYLPDGEEVRATPAMRTALGKQLDAAGHAHRTGATWTTDAPWRETALELRAHRATGTLTVEMEAAAVFAVARVRGIAAAALLTVSDVLEEHDWTPSFHAGPTLDGLHRALDAAIAVAAGSVVAP